MKLKQYAAELNKLVEKYPNAKVVCSADDEGNSYGEVVFAPQLCYFREGEILLNDDLEELKPNAVLIN